MPSFLPFFDKASHQVEKLRSAFPSHPRLAALRLAAWALGRAVSGHVIGEVTLIPPSRRKGDSRLAFLLRGGIGDIIINLSWLDALTALPGSGRAVDIYTNTPKDVMRALCRNMPCVAEIRSLKEHVPFERYDAVFDVMQNPQLKAVCWERLEKMSSALYDYAQRLLRFQAAHASFYLDENQAMGIHYADVMGGGRRRQPDFDGSLHLKDSDFTLTCVDIPKVREKFGLARPFVTLQREAGSCADSLKLWSAEKYRELLHAMETRFPAYDLVLIGSDGSVDLAGDACVKDLRGKTSFEELMVMVKEASLHIGGEGLIPHLRHFLRAGSSVVLFGPSCARMLGYPENIALSGTECPNGCEGIMQTWQQTCLKGHAYCRSLEQIQVEDVLRACGKVLVHEDAMASRMVEQKCGAFEEA